MAIVIYTLCALTSAVSAGLLLSSYVKARYRLLLWSATCFTLLAVSNLFLVVDKLILIQIDFSVWRNLMALVAISILLYGMIADSE